MSHLPFTLLAYFFNSLSVLSNKFLLSKTIPDPLIYIFYISLFSLAAVFALPFTIIPSASVLYLSSLSTIFWTLGAYFMFWALKSGQISRVIPIIGTLIPLILLIFASKTNAISPAQIWAVLILVLGMIFLNLKSLLSLSISKKEILFEILSAGFFAFSYILLREAYQKSDFFSVLIWSRLILIPLTIFILILPALRRKIITSHGPKLNFFSKTGLIFLGGQFSGVISELLILFSISLANPALVNSLQGTQYIFLLVLAREKHTNKELLPKLAGIIAIGAGLYLLAFA